MISGQVLSSVLLFNMTLSMLQFASIKSIFCLFS